MSSFDLADTRNVFPYTTFNWVGLDGSEVLTHMTPGDQLQLAIAVWTICEKHISITETSTYQRIRCCCLGMEMVEEDRHQR